jgi:hypothetical protein
MAETVSALLQFYRGLAPDAAGRLIADIWAWDHRRLEMVHDYIQWLFPLPEPSRFNPDVPLLHAGDASAFKTDADLRLRLERSLAVMLDFYGLGRNGGMVGRAPTFIKRSTDWLTPLNHNYLRLTRILICLGHCGLETEAKSLLACLEDVAAREGAGVIAPRTLMFWRDAVK